MNRSISSAQDGFTLIELMVTMAVGGIVLAAMIGFFYSQQRASVTQQAVLDLQQNMRAGFTLLEKELRMAGFDPTRNAGAGITTATATTLAFSADLDGDGNLVNGAAADQKEIIQYGLNASSGLVRNAGDGAVDELIPNVDALQFSYLDEGGAVTTNPSRVRTVQVLVVARSGASLPGLFYDYTDSTTYQDRQGNDLTLLNGLSNPPADDFRRIVLYSSVDLRNMGLPSDGRQ